MRESSWILREVDGACRDRLARELEISSLLAKLLTSRGVSDTASGRRFLSPSPDDLVNPLELDDVEKAVERIIRALNGRESIMVWGDEDCDGVTATAVIFETLSNLGGDVSSYIPSRGEEGIGLSKYGLDRAKDDGVKLLITVDCGITSRREAEYSKELGIDVVITDHHELPSSLPEATAVVNPKRGNDQDSGVTHLAGVGVAFKVAQGVAMRKLGITPSQYLSAERGLLPLVLIGSVADKVPLKGENRIFARLGLGEFAKSQRPAIQALREISESDYGEEPDVEKLSRYVIPALSAGKSEGGRNRALKLLLSQEHEEARGIALSLAEASRAWQERAREAYARVLRRVRFSPIGVLVVVDNTLSPYFLGYCSSRLKEQFRRPAVVIGTKGGVAVGEGRAPPGFDLVSAFRSCEDLLLSYGGHKPAAGFSLEFSKVKAFSERLAEMEGREVEESPPLLVDEELPLSEVTPELLQEMALLAPFGESNPPPLFLARGVRMLKAPGGYTVSDLGVFLRCDSFRAGWVDLSGKPVELDIVYQIDRRGRITLGDARPSEFNR